MLTGRHHLAFQAKDREMVNEFHLEALAHGRQSNGEPAKRSYIQATMLPLLLTQMEITLKLYIMGKHNVLLHP